MPRRKLSEFRAKTLVLQALDIPYAGWSIDATSDYSQQLQAIKMHKGSVVVKVDQGVKGRFKKGLVLLDVDTSEVQEAIKKLANQGYQWFIVEPQLAHQQDSEHYLSISYGRAGITLSYTAYGGINVESHASDMRHIAINEDTNWPDAARETGFSEEQLKGLVDLFNKQHMTFLEINPYLVTKSGLHLLDLAIEVDDAAAFFVSGWHEDDFRSYRNLTPEEKTVAALAEKSPASFKLDIINPNGSIFLLLSGGGASIVVADEVYNQGQGSKLANYGEYSGNPNAEETYIYSLAVLRLLIKSASPRKVLFIGGAVANFTDISNTFNGIIKAIREVASDLQKQDVKIFIRRGGPRQEIGLAKIELVLHELNLLGAVHGPSIPLPSAVAEAIKEVV